MVAKRLLRESFWRKKAHIAHQVKLVSEKKILVSKKIEEKGKKGKSPRITGCPIFANFI